jgi:hypothetical protein
MGNGIGHNSGKNGSTPNGVSDSWEQVHYDLHAPGLVPVRTQTRDGHGRPIVINHHQDGSSSVRPANLSL